MSEQEPRRRKSNYKAVAREKYWAAFNRNAFLINAGGCCLFWLVVVALRFGLLPAGPGILVFYLSQVLVGAGAVLSVLALIYGKSKTWRKAIYFSAIITLPTGLLILAPLILAAGFIALV